MAARCLIVTYYFPPTGGGGVQRISKFIKYLARDGWEFTVLTSSEPNTLPEDKTLLNDLPKNINIVSIPPAINNGVLSRLRARFRSGFVQRWLAAFFFLPDSRRGWARSAGRYVKQLCRRESYDVVFITAPPYSLAITASFLTDQLSIPVVLDMRDPWSTNPYKIYPTPLHKLLDKYLEKKSLKNVKYGISAYESFIEHIRKAYNVGGKWQYIPNGFDEDDFVDLKPLTLEKDRFHLAFSGTFYSHFNNPLLLFRIFSVLKKRYPGSYARLRFHHIGQSIPDITALAREEGCRDILYSWGYLDHHQTLNTLAAMDAYCVILDPGHPRASNTIGGKVYEYLRFGKPVLALVPDEGEAASLLNRGPGHLIVNPYEPDKAAAALDALINGAVDGNNWDEMLLNSFRRETLARQLHHFLKNLLNEK